MNTESFNLKFLKLFQLAIGILMFPLASLITKDGSKFIFNFMYNGNSGIFYLLLAVIVSMLRFDHKKSDYIYQNNESPVSLLFSFFIDVLTFYGIFSICLLPFSGFGFIEWTFLFIFLLKYLVFIRQKNVVFDSSIIITCVTGLFIIKIFVISFLPDDIWRDVIKHNNSLRWVIFALTIYFSLMQFRDINFFEKIKLTTLPATNKKNRNLVSKKIISLFSSIKHIGDFITNPFVLVSIGLLLLFLSFGFIMLYKIKILSVDIYNDFWELFQTLFAKILTTDDTALVFSYKLNINYWFSVLLFSIYIIMDTLYDMSILDIEKTKFFINLENEIDYDKKRLIKYFRLIPDSNLLFRYNNELLKEVLISKMENNSLEQR